MDHGTALYALGSNGSGQLGVGSFDDCSQLTEATLPFGLQHVRLIAAGGNHTVLVLSNGDMYAAGDGSDGRCLFKLVSWGSTSLKEPRFRRAEPSSKPAYKVVRCAATWVNAREHRFLPFRPYLFVCDPCR